MAFTRPEVKVLMLHGFAQTGPFFEIKTKALSKRLRDTISSCYNVEPEAVEFVFPTAPLQLRPSDLAVTCTESILSSEDTETWGWWRNLDTINRYIGIESSLARLLLLTHLHGPFHGVVGFSQGAALAAMFASWCESGSVPGRNEALLEMSSGDPLMTRMLSSPPQRPLDFALCFSGFRGTLQFYHGFYSPQVVTPVIHVLGEYDTMVGRDESTKLVASCSNSYVIRHQGVHFVPRDVVILNQIMKVLENVIIFKAAASALNETLLSDYVATEISLSPWKDVGVLCRSDSLKPPSGSPSESASERGGKSRSASPTPFRIRRRYRLA